MLIQRHIHLVLAIKFWTEFKFSRVILTRFTSRGERDVNKLTSKQTKDTPIQNRKKDLTKERQEKENEV